MNDCDTTVTVACTKLGGKTILGDDLEKKLFKYILELESMLFGLTAEDIKWWPYQLLVTNGIDHPFGEGKAEEFGYTIFCPATRIKLH